MKHLLKQYTWILGIGFGLLLLVLLTGCNQPPFTQGPILEQESNTQSNSTLESSTGVHNMEGIAHALGCIFAPDRCKAQSNK